ncbi:MAG: pilin [Candidatus Shapirobacteria bacterium]
MSRLSYLLVLISYLLVLISPAPAPALAQQDWKARDPRCVDKANPDVATIQGLECLFYNTLSVVVTIAGLVFLVMFIVGGFNYVLSNGDPKKAAGAAGTLTSAIIGLVGVIASWLILRLIQNFTGISTLTIFQIPG